MDRVYEHDGGNELWVSGIDGVRYAPTSEFDTIVTVCQDHIIDHVADEQVYLWYPLCDSNGNCDDWGGLNDASSFDAAIRATAMELSRGSDVLVHCHAGVSRSAAVSAGVIMEFDAVDAETAVETVRDGRGIVYVRGRLYEMLEDREGDANG